MPSVEDHYKNLLARHYSWIYGGAEQQLSTNRAFFSQHAARPGGSGVAVDLGAGPGFQSIPLAELGFHVIAIDMNSDLLDELRERAGGLPIVAIKDDLLNFARHSPRQSDLIVCMGDTLTHLNTLQDVQTLIRRAQKSLVPMGRLVIGFRDMSVAVKDLERFIAVRSDADRIFTCFLEYEKRHVRVHDLVYERSGDQWVLHKSFFRKLRISTGWLRGQIEKAGLDMEHVDVNHGVTTMIAHKP
jgi:2-polyprenyl-3-methyl-5-hydroxy-6-metoxy-1,4-benzoquinol methylase